MTLKLNFIISLFFLFASQWVFAQKPMTQVEFKGELYTVYPARLHDNGLPYSIYTRYKGLKHYDKKLKNKKRWNSLETTEEEFEDMLKIGVLPFNPLPVPDGKYLMYYEIHPYKYFEIRSEDLVRVALTFGIQNGKVHGATVGYDYFTGNVIVTGSLVDGKKEGQWVARYGSDSLIQNMENDILHGRQILKRNGIVRSVKTYAHGDLTEVQEYNEDGVKTKHAKYEGSSAWVYTKSLYKDNYTEEISSTMDTSQFRYRRFNNGKLMAEIERMPKNEYRFRDYIGDEVDIEAWYMPKDSFRGEKECLAIAEKISISQYGTINFDRRNYMVIDLGGYFDIREEYIAGYILKSIHRKRAGDKYTFFSIENPWDFYIENWREIIKPTKDSVILRITESKKRTEIVEYCITSKLSVNRYPKIDTAYHLEKTVRYSLNKDGDTTRFNRYTFGSREKVPLVYPVYINRSKKGVNRSYEVRNSSVKFYSYTPKDGESSTRDSLWFKADAQDSLVHFFIRNRTKDGRAELLRTFVLDPYNNSDQDEYELGHTRLKDVTKYKNVVLHVNGKPYSGRVDFLNGTIRRKKVSIDSSDKDMPILNVFGLHLDDIQRISSRHYIDKGEWTLLRNTYQGYKYYGFSNGRLYALYGNDFKVFYNQEGYLSSSFGDEKQTASYKNGLKHGYFRSERKAATYYKDSLHGTYRHYDWYDGQITYEAHFHMDTLHGPFHAQRSPFQYYEEGKFNKGFLDGKYKAGTLYHPKILEATLDHGNLIDTAYVYFKEGNLKARVIFDSSQSFYQVKNISTRNSTGSENDSFRRSLDYQYWRNMVVDFNSTGNEHEPMLKFNPSWTASYTYFYKTGVKASEGRIYGGRKVGLWTTYDKNGALYKKVNYDSSYFIKNNGDTIEHGGHIVMYKPNGEILLEGYIKNTNSRFNCEQEAAIDVEEIIYNQLEVESNAQIDSITGSVVEYHPTGAIRAEGQVVRGKRVGEWRFYNLEGQLEKIGSYREGIPIGIWYSGDLGGIPYVDDACDYGVNENLPPHPVDINKGIVESVEIKVGDGSETEMDYLYYRYILEKNTIMLYPYYGWYSY